MRDIKQTQKIIKNNAEWCNGSTADSDSVSRGSNPFSVVTKNGVWLSLVERYVRDVEVACSNHVTPIGYKAGDIRDCRFLRSLSF